MMKNILYILIALIIFSSCSSNEEGVVTTTQAETEFTLSHTLLEFGSATTEDPVTRFFFLQNSDQAEISLNFNNDQSFSITSNDPVCLVRLSKSKRCDYRVVFSPGEVGINERVLVIGERLLTLRGRGLLSNQLTLTPSSWNLGDIVAGSVHTRDVTISNNGDNALAPPLLNDQRLTVTESTCNEVILPKESCRYRLRFQNGSAGPFDDEVEFSSTQGAITNLEISGIISPGIPSGTIELLNVPERIAANGNDSNIITARVRDEFLNLVSDGTSCQINATNLTLDRNSEVTANGELSFQITSTTIKRDSQVFVTCGIATGFRTIGSLSGDIDGVISFESFNAFADADGESEIIIRTQTLRDENGQVVDDGKELFFETNGPGTLVANSGISISGVSFIRLQAPTTAGITTVNVRSNPIRDGNDNIIGYRANGSFSIQFTSTQAADGFPITPSESVIFSRNENVPSGLSGTSLIEIGPILDQNGNLRGPGQIVNVTITNGVSVDKFQGNSVFSITTDSDSIARFTLQGIGVRGTIGVSATVNSFTQQREIFAINRNTVIPRDNDESVKLYKTYLSTSAPLANQLRYREDWGLSTLSERDSFLIGGSNYRGAPTSLSRSYYPIHNDCLLNERDRVLLAPCLTVSDADGLSFFGNMKPTFLTINQDENEIEVNNINALPHENGYLNRQYQGYNIFKFEEKDRMYLFAGIDRSNNEVNQELITIDGISGYDTQFDSLSTVAQNPTIALHPASFASKIEIANEVIFFGGLESDNGSFTPSKTITKLTSDANAQNVERIEVETYTDNTFESPFLGKVGSSLLRRNGYIYIIGGMYEDLITGNLIHSDEVWSIDENDLQAGFTLVCNCAPIRSYAPPLEYFIGDSSGDFLHIMEATRPKVLQLAHENVDLLIFPGDIVYEITSQFSFPESTRYNFMANYRDAHINPLTNKVYLTELLTNNASDRSQTHNISVYQSSGAPRSIAEFDVLPLASNYAREFTIKASSFFSSNIGNRVIYEIYNFDTDSFERLGESNFSDEAQTVSNETTFTLQGNLSDYIENDRVLVSIRPDPSLLGLNTKYIFKINYLRFEGIY